MPYTMITNKKCLVVLVILCISLMNGEFGKGIKDPTQIVDKALACFNDKYIYSTCNEAYRLDVSGNLHVPQDHTDEFCNGPCLTETNLVLHCIENIFENFEFSNTATIQDVRETVKAGCGHSIDRGNFNVAEHIQAEESKSQKICIPLMMVVVCIALAYLMLLL